MICYICQKEFVSKHFNQKLCSVECKKEATKQVKKRYKQTEKGRKSYDRWCKNPTKKEIDKKYQQTEKAKIKARYRSKLFRQKNPEYTKRQAEIERKRERWLRPENRKKNNIATRKYGKTEKGRWKHKVYKYKLRHNESGIIDKVLWEKKLKDLEGKCQKCGKIEGITIDHIKPLSKGGTNHIDNLQPLCRSCNCKKSNRYE